MSGTRVKLSRRGRAQRLNAASTGQKTRVSISAKPLLFRSLALAWALRPPREREGGRALTRRSEGGDDMAVGLLAPQRPGTSFDPGTDVRSRCPRCSYQNPSTGRFCGECGASLRARCERRQVSVLLVDVSGFTAMSERLDPEAGRAIMDPAFEVIEDAVHTHDGTVNQFLGDGVMALFGVVAGLEDHACRALRAALTIQEEFEPLREAVRREHGFEFRVRMGLHTGSVVLGVIGGDLRTDYTAAGQTTSVAARLLSLARADEIVVSDCTRTLADRSFAFAELSRLDVANGGQSPIRTYAVLSQPLECGGGRRC